MSAWTLTDITRTFDGGGWLSSERIVAVDAASVTVEVGSRVAIIGESGSGKSTLVRTGLGLLGPDSGSIELLGQPTAGWSQRRWREARNRAQLLFQDPAAMLHPSVAIGVLLEESCRLHQPQADAPAVVAELLGAVGLQGRASARLHHLSGGERRRAGMARVLLAKPSLLVADEPTAGLDAALKAELIELMLDRLGPECAFVLVSHDLPLVLWACDEVYVMAEGRVVDHFRVGDEHSADRHDVTRRLLTAACVTPRGRAAREGA